MFYRGTGNARKWMTGDPRCILDTRRPTSNPTLPLFLAIGALFGALAAASADVISYAENRRRFLRVDQNPRRMALQTAAVTFAFFLAAAVVLSFVLSYALRPAGQ